MRTLVVDGAVSVGTCRLLRLRLWRENRGYLCEREIRERDGSSFVQVLPFDEVEHLRAFLHSDPHYRAVRKLAEQCIATAERRL